MLEAIREYTFMISIFTKTQLSTGAIVSLHAEEMKVQ